jgi:hypothetical protein
MAIQRWAGGRITCLSGDTKPTGVPDQTELVETDTRKKFYYNSGTSTWIPQELALYKSFKVVKVGSTTHVINEQKRSVSSNTDTQLAVQAVLDTMVSGNSWEFVWDADVFTLNNPIVFPNTTGTGDVRATTFKGTGWVQQKNVAGGTTCLKPSATFPAGSFLMKTANEGDVTPKTSQVFIEKFQLYNEQNPTDVRGILLEAGNLRNGHMCWSVKDIFANYIHTVINLKGLVWWGMFENINCNVSSANFIGDAVIKLESGGHDGSFGPTPNNNMFRNIQSGNGNGEYNSFLDIRSGSGNFFDKILIDGRFYRNAAVYLSNTDQPTGAGPVAYNTFRDMWTLDLEYPIPNNVIAAIYMHGGTGNVSSNQFKNCNISNYPVALKMDDVNVFKNEIELVARWGGNTIVNDTGSGQANTIVVRPGLKVVANEEPIIHTGGVSRVIDMRKGAQNGGLATSISDGSTISHGLMTTPLWISVQSSVAGEFASVTARTTTTFTVALRKHDNTAGTTQGVYWRAGLYA